MVVCAVFGCKSNSEQKEANVTFHAFPTEDETRKKWIEGTGKKNWVPHKYSKMCSKHFEQQCVRKTQKLTFIKKFAVPTLFIPNVPIPEIDLKDGVSMVVESQDQDQLNVFSEKYFKYPVTHEVLGEPLPTEFMDCESQPDKHAQLHGVTAKSVSTECTITSPTKLKLTLQLNRQTLLAESRRKKIEAMRSKSRRLKKKNAELSAVIEHLKTKRRFINQESADILATLNQNNSDFLRSNKSKFSPEVRKFALNLHSISTRVYNFVREHFNTCLPQTRTLTRWYQIVDEEPGFSSESLESGSSETFS